ncbi:MAG: DUF5686 family protein [Nonlabens sp.]|nr:DUF5686 family protein [Nonlabens sp.]
MRYLLICTLLALNAHMGTAQDTGKELALKVINARAVNDPQIATPFYTYNAYENLKIAGDPEAITGPGFKNDELRKTLMQTQVFFSEKNSKHIHDSIYGDKEVINGVKMPGFKKPVYPIYNITFQSENVYDQPYLIYDISFKNPLALKNSDAYTYRILGDTIINKRETYILEFRPVDIDSPDKLFGTIYVDQATHGVPLARYYRAGDLEVRATHKLTYDSRTNLWLNDSRELFIRNKKTTKELELLGSRFEVGLEKFENRENDLYVILKSQASEHDFEQRDFGRRWIKAVLTDEAPEQSDSYWKKYRMDEPYSTDELSQFMSLDSIVTASKITRKLATLEKFKVGYYPVGFFDIDLKYLIKYNNYEAFRLGIGGTTNEKFSESFALSGYVAYGTKDKNWKYKTNIGYRLSKERNTWINIYRSDDIAELGGAPFLTDARVYSLFEPRLVNIPSFYLYKEYGMSLQQRIIPSVISEISLSRKRIAQTTPYVFINNGTLFPEYVLAEVTAAARWSPASEFMRTPEGYLETRTSYPVLSGQITKGVQGIAKSDFNYIKLSGKATYIINSNNKSRTELHVEGHFANGDVPLTHLFHAYPNAPNKDEILQRFSVAGRGSFETMYFNEFFSDRIAIMQAKHSFAPFNIASFLKPELVLLTKYAIGDLQDRSKHANVGFTTMDKGYLESGFELNKLLFGFGVSGAYRYGAYHLPNFADNISLKFTFYLEL